MLFGYLQSRKFKLPIASTWCKQIVPTELTISANVSRLYELYLLPSLCRYTLMVHYSESIRLQFKVARDFCLLFCNLRINIRDQPMCNMCISASLCVIIIITSFQFRGSSCYRRIGFSTHFGRPSCRNASRYWAISTVTTWGNSAALRLKLIPSEQKLRFFFILKPKSNLAGTWQIYLLDKFRSQV